MDDNERQRTIPSLGNYKPHKVPDGLYALIVRENEVVNVHSGDMYISTCYEDSIVDFIDLESHVGDSVVIVDVDKDGFSNFRCRHQLGQLGRPPLDHSVAVDELLNNEMELVARKFFADRCEIETTGTLTFSNRFGIIRGEQVVEFAFLNGQTKKARLKEIAAIVNNVEMRPNDYLVHVKGNKVACIEHTDGELRQVSLTPERKSQLFCYLSASAQKVQQQLKQERTLATARSI